MYGYWRIIVGDTIGKEIANIIEKISPKQYEFFHVPDIPASNVVFVNDCLITRCSVEFPRSIELIRDKVGGIIEVNMSELSKIDGALTCCSVLYNR
jgi:dimethylargininase